MNTPDHHPDAKQVRATLDALGHQGCHHAPSQGHDQSTQLGAFQAIVQRQVGRQQSSRHDNPFQSQGAPPGQGEDQAHEGDGQPGQINPIQRLIREEQDRQRQEDRRGQADQARDGAQGRRPEVTQVGRQSHAAHGQQRRQSAPLPGSVQGSQSQKEHGKQGGHGRQHGLLADLFQTGPLCSGLCRARLLGRNPSQVVPTLQARTQQLNPIHKAPPGASSVRSPREGA